MGDELGHHPADEMIGHTILEEIRQPPQIADAISDLRNIRERGQISDAGIWSDGRIEAAAQGLDTYVRVFNAASQDLRKYLTKAAVIQGFTGVRPVVSLGEMDPQSGLLESSITEHGILDTAFPVIREELAGFLPDHSGGKIKLEKIDYRNTPYIKKWKFVLMNEPSLRNVARENPDLFQPDCPSVTQWLSAHPEKWPMVQGFGSDTDILAGVVSGFPREASELYSRRPDAPLDWSATLKNIGRRPIGEWMVTRIMSMEKDSPEIRKAEYESAIRFTHYSDADLTWVRDAAALLRHSAEIFGIRNIIY